MPQDTGHTVLGIVTMPADPPIKACTGGYLCDCTACLPKVAELVTRGVRRSTAIPIRIKRAA